MAIEAHLPQTHWENAAIYLPDGSDYIAALLGIFRLERTAFPLNAHLTKHEVIPLLEHTSTDIIITSSTLRPVMEDVKSMSDLPLRIIYAEECQPEDWMPVPRPRNTEMDKPMLLLTTSGSTGGIKIVPLSERNVASSVLGYIDKMCFERMEEKRIRYILASPLSSAYGLMILFACLTRC